MNICVSLDPAAISVSSPGRSEFLLWFHTHLLISAFPVFSAFFPLSSTPAETTIFLYSTSPNYCPCFQKEHAIIPDPEGLGSQDRLLGWRNTFYPLMHTEVVVVVKAVQCWSSSRPTETLSTASQCQVLTTVNWVTNLTAGNKLRHPCSFQTFKGKLSFINLAGFSRLYTDKTTCFILFPVLAIGLLHRSASPSMFFRQPCLGVVQQLKDVRHSRASCQNFTLQSSSQSWISALARDWTQIATISAAWKTLPQKTCPHSLQIHCSSSFQEQLTTSF